MSYFRGWRKRLLKKGWNIEEEETELKAIGLESSLYWRLLLEINCEKKVKSFGIGNKGDTT